MPLAVYKANLFLHTFRIRIARLLVLNAIFVLDLLNNDIQTEHRHTHAIIYSVQCIALALERVIFRLTTNNLSAQPCAILLLLFYYIISLYLFLSFSSRLFRACRAYQMVVKYIFAI